MKVPASSPTPTPTPTPHAPRSHRATDMHTYVQCIHARRIGKRKRHPIGLESENPRHTQARTIVRRTPWDMTFFFGSVGWGHADCRWSHPVNSQTEPAASHPCYVQRHLDGYVQMTAARDG